MSNRFTSRLSDDDDFKRDELIRKIEHSVEQMTLSELEALAAAKDETCKKEKEI